jgi:predicted ATPase
LGRDRELATLSRAVGRLADGHGIVVTLEGDAGSGKSTLLDALVSIADLG